MKCISFGPRVALIGSLLVSALQGFAQNTAASNSSEPVRLTVAPNSSSRITMKTLPKAICVLHAEGDSAAEHSFKTFADDEGNIRFQVRPSAESDQSAHFAVDCTADGKASTFALELRPNTVPSFDMPAPQGEVRTPQPGDVIRPALSKADAARLSSDELAKRGYPIRPDAKQAPDAFGAWLKAVTQPSRLVDARQVARSDIHHVKPVKASNFETSSNWSGFELRGSAGAYDLVMGEWYVPTVYYENNTHTYSAYWIGLDGDGTSDLWQAGTEQEIQDIKHPGNSFRLHHFLWVDRISSIPSHGKSPTQFHGDAGRFDVHRSVGGQFRAEPVTVGSVRDLIRRRRFAWRVHDDLQLPWTLDLRGMHQHWADRYWRIGSGMDHGASYGERLAA
jgi:hypothetical protein